jgi:hypothetical protein
MINGFSKPLTDLLIFYLEDLKMARKRTVNYAVVDIKLFGKVQQLKLMLSF